MELLQCLKNNSSTFHIRTKEEIDQLFNELSVQKLPIDNKLDFDIRMAIQKVKLQLYYELKLVEYRRSVNSAKKVASCESNLAPTVKEKKDRTSKKKKKKTSFEKEDERRKNKTKEELIAENKARVAKYHPEPDLNTCSTTFYKARRKNEHEKEMMEKFKGHWVSIVSIPMKG